MDFWILGLFEQRGTPTFNRIQTSCSLTWLYSDPWSPSGNCIYVVAKGLTTQLLATFGNLNRLLKAPSDFSTSHSYDTETATLRGLWGFLSCSLACQRWVPIATWNFFRIGACCPYAGPLISRIYKMPWLLGVQRRSSMASLNMFWCLDITVRLLTSCYLPSLVIMSRKTWDLPKPINRSDRFFWGSP